MVGPLRYMQQNVLTLVGLSPDRTSHETKMIKAILFDAFGTLAEIAERRRPYAKLLSLADTKSRPTDADYAAIVMGRDWKIHEITDWLGVTQTQAQGAGVFEGLATELLSMSLFPETAEILAHLRACGLKLGICSNLAQPYAAPLRSLLPIEMDEYVWSFEVGAIKPEPSQHSIAHQTDRHRDAALRVRVPGSFKFAACIHDHGLKRVPQGIGDLHPEPRHDLVPQHSEALPGRFVLPARVRDHPVPRFVSLGGQAASPTSASN